MDKLKELFKDGWTVSGLFDGEYYFVATKNDLDDVKAVVHNDIKIAVSKLYGECKNVPTSS
jgi:uncharacterized secreted protein with C-terminal beta-propeller domain